MGMCYSLRARLLGAHPSIAYGGDGEPHAGQLEHADPQLLHRLREELVAKEKADKKRSKSIDKTLKAEKREYKQTHRLLLLVPDMLQPSQKGALSVPECLGNL